MSAKTGEIEVCIDVETTKQKKESTRKYFESESLWWKTKKGPFGLSFYAVAVFYKVLFNHFLLEKPLHSSWSSLQETAVRTFKWSLDSPLVVSRRNASFLEGFIKLFKCSEPLTKLRGTHGVRGYWIGPERWEGRYPEAIILFIHGGGYVAASSLLAVQPLCHLLKILRKEHKKHVRILSIDYPLAPESQSQEIIACAEHAYRWLVGESAVHGSDNVMLCGDSAGGGIVLGLLQRIYQNRDKRETNSSKPPLILPFGAMLLSPWVNPSTNSASHHTNAKYDYLPVHLIPLAAECYVYGREQGPRKERQEVPHKRKAELENGKRVLDWLEQLQLPNGDWVATDMVQPESKSKPELSRRRSKERMSITNKSPGNPFRHPLVCPIYTRRKTLASYPPLFVCYGGKEVFRDDIELFIRRFIKAKKSYSPTNSNNSANGDVVTTDFSSERRSAMNGQHPDIEIEFGEHMVHDYLMLYEFFGKEGRRALKRMSAFISNKLDAKINYSRQHTRIPSSSPVLPELAPMPALELPAAPVPSPLSSPPIHESMAGPAVPPELVLDHDDHNRISSSVSLPEWSKVKRVKARSAFSDTSHRGEFRSGVVPNSRRLPRNYFSMINTTVPTNVPTST